MHYIRLIALSTIQFLELCSLGFLHQLFLLLSLSYQFKLYTNIGFLTHRTSTFLKEKEKGKKERRTAKTTWKEQVR